MLISHKDFNKFKRSVRAVELETLTTDDLYGGKPIGDRYPVPFFIAPVQQMATPGAICPLLQGSSSFHVCVSVIASNNVMVLEVQPSLSKTRVNFTKPLKFAKY